MRALRLAPQSTKSQQKKTHVHSGIRTRNRQYAYILVPRPLPAPSMLVLAGQNRNWLFRFFFVYKRIFRCRIAFRLPPLCQICLCGSVHVGGALNRRVPELQVGFKGPGLRFGSPGGSCAREIAGRHVLPCFGFQLHTTEGGQAKRDNCLSILHILDARGHNSTKAT